MRQLFFICFFALANNLFAQISINGTATPAGAYGTDFELTETFPGSGIWYGTFALTVGELKIRKDASWSPVHWTASANNAVFPIGIAAQNGQAIQIPVANNYHITFDEASQKATFISHLSIIGSATPSHNWTTDYDMTLSSSDPYEWYSDIFLTSDSNFDKFKFRLNHDWTFNYGGAFFPQSNGILNGPDIIVTNTNQYTSTFNVVNLDYNFLPEFPCNNTVSNSTSDFYAQCGTNTVSNNIIPGQYIGVTNLVHLSNININTNNANDYITIRKASDNSIITHGSGFVDFVYVQTMGNIEIHINSDEFCGWGGSPRTLSLYENCPCDNSQLNPTITTQLECGYTNVGNVSAGDYFVTSGYSDQTIYDYISSLPTDYITLRKSSDNSILEFGQYAISLLYETGMGDIEVHINEDLYCSTSSSVREITIAENCNCDNSNAYSSAPVNVGLECGSNNTFNANIFIGQYITTTGYQDGTTLVFNSIDNYINIRRADNNALIAVGTNQVTLLYQATFGDLEIHLNDDIYCQSVNTQENLSIEMRCGCDNPLATPEVDLVCGDNLIDPFYPSGYYTPIINYPEGAICEFSSTVPTDFITIRRGPSGLIVVSGITPLYVNTNEFNGYDIQLHINSNELCGTQGSDREVRVHMSCPCENGTQYPTAPINVHCGTNIIATDQQAGQYNITTGYPEGSTATFASSVSTDFISLYTADDQLLAFGPTPVTLDYYSSTYGNLKMHINTNGDCGSISSERTTTVVVNNCPCINAVQNPVAEYSGLKCGDNIITTAITSGQFCKVSQNFTSDYLVTFYTEVPTDIISVKTNATDRFYGVGEVTVGFGSYPNFEVHINEDENCSVGTTPRTLKAFINCVCENAIQQGQGSIDVNCGNNVLSNTHFNGKYIVSKGYPLNGAAIFTSSNPNDFITIIDKATNLAIANGYSPLQVFITADNMSLEMHLNTNVACGTDGNSSQTAVKVLCNCFNSTNFAGDINPCVNGQTEVICSGFFGVILNNALDIVLESSVSTDYFHIYRSDNLEPVYSGNSPAIFAYLPSMGPLIASVFSNPTCGDDGLYRTVNISYIGDCPDQDMDFVSDYNDNCISIPNTNQSDHDHDGIGDVCDTDLFGTTEKVGIGTTNPKAKLHIKDGSLYLDKPNSGLILRSDNGDCYVAKPTEVENPATGEITMELKLIKIDCPSGN